MIAGIGTDIASIERFKKILERRAEAFARRILTDSELEIFASHPQQAAWLAKRFAAKEAASKALGTGIGKVSFQHLETFSDERGAPRMRFLDYARELQKERGIKAIHLSLSDEAEHALAFVILEC
ncbi:holo-ACP synthase [Endozoicomonas sp. 8E]|uniref:holo-ACP synthase n=1 Tax=Endozoicomonas sp. 8E TaxID=3035692 RepID=UPI0029394211|nr:holo-ACP synthase [Endozoicomonas sp. 8E]WOG25558.1 holo-ACP synthase [Endozoicomonas sp. 8E]